MNTVGTPLLWGGFAVVVAIMLAIDLLLQGRRGSHSMTMKQAAGWSILWVTLSLLFNAAFWWYLVQTQGRAVADPQALAFLTGYLIEKALAVDNVFVWLMLFSYFAVPPALQRRVFVYGVLGAIVLRTIMIFAGSWLISQFDWLLYVFGAFLLFTGVKMALAKEDDSGIGDKPLVRWIRSHLRMTDKIESERFFTRKNGVLFATPLLLVLILVELSDVIFAVDSIPAIFAVTTDPFIVLTSNLFAILGLRAMYFLLAGVAERFSMLKYGLSVILVFIGVKMLIVDFYHIPVAISLGVVGGILAATLLINAWVNRQHDKQRKTARVICYRAVGPRWRRGNQL
ncbi:TerC family protein [Klebsiella pneumoniae]|nr:TerC family protein [Klebsiella pneumoniae]